MQFLRQDNNINIRNQKNSENENIEEVVRSLKRTRLDSLLGLSNNFLNQ